MSRLKQASEITERGTDRYAIRQAEIRAVVEEAIKPLNDWEEIQNPEQYIETRLGRYIHLLEGLLDRAAALGDMDRVHAIALDLIRLSKLGRSKAEINVGVSKLREEMDFSKLKDAELAKLLSEVEGGK